MKKLILIPLLVGLVSTPLYAGYPRHEPGEQEIFYDKARVINVKPIVEIVEVPVEDRECWTEEVTGTRHRNNSGAGHQVGRGDGKKVATVAGTIIGAAVGNEMGKKQRHQPYAHTEHHCRVSEEYYEEERIRGYQVTYRYGGETFMTEMDRDPGKFLRLRVKLTPID
jgi:uncharacterized protein YcfJ